MNSTALKRQQIYRGLEHLSAESLEKVAEVVDSLQEPKPQVPRPLGGLWKDIPFDVTNREVRALRRKLSRRVLKRKI